MITPEDKDGQIEKLVGAISFAASMNDNPLVIDATIVRQWAEQMFAFGVRQTDEVQEVAPALPAWMRDAVKEQAHQPPKARSALPAGTARVGKAPALPKKRATRKKKP